MFLLAAVLGLLNIEENNRIEERQQVVLWQEVEERLTFLLFMCLLKQLTSECH